MTRWWFQILYIYIFLNVYPYLGIFSNLTSAYFFRWIGWNHLSRCQKNTRTKLVEFWGFLSWASQFGDLPPTKARYVCSIGCWPIDGWYLFRIMRVIHRTQFLLVFTHDAVGCSMGWLVLIWPYESKYLLRRYKLPTNCTLSAFRAADPWIHRVMLN